MLLEPNRKSERRMNATSNMSSHFKTAPGITLTPNIGPPTASSRSRFPRLQECAHFHYEVSLVDIPLDFKVGMCPAENETNEKPALNPVNGHNLTPSGGINPMVNSMTASMISTASSQSPSVESSIWFHLVVVSHKKQWIIYRNYENFRYLDKFFHDCIFDRKFSCLDELLPLDSSVSIELLASSPTSSILPKKFSKSSEFVKQLRETLEKYLKRFQEISFINPINCGPILNWFEVTNEFALLISSLTISKMIWFMF